MTNDATRIVLIVVCFTVIVLILALMVCARADRVADQWDMFRQQAPPLADTAAGNRGPATVPAVVGGRPIQCPVRAWCGCFLQSYLGLNDKSLWNAREWLKRGRAISSPRVGAIAVYARGKGGHVGLITQVLASNRVVLLSGNDRGAVRERERSTAGVLGYRQL
jgi:uncharacterized protein (TIGR02594 family)